MNSVYRKLRPLAIGAVAAASIVAGMIAVWDRAPRDVMASTPTWVYLGILALLLCPLLTVVCWACDRRAHLHAARLEAMAPRPQPQPLSKLQPTTQHALVEQAELTDLADHLAFEVVREHVAEAVIAELERSGDLACQAQPLVVDEPREAPSVDEDGPRDAVARHAAEIAHRPAPVRRPIPGSRHRAVRHVPKA